MSLNLPLLANDDDDGSDGGSGGNNVVTKNGTNVSNSSSTHNGTAAASNQKVKRKKLHRQQQQTRQRQSRITLPNMTMKFCGRGPRCNSIATARFGLHLRGDTPGSNRLVDLILSGTIPIFTEEEQYQVLPSFIDWNAISYFANVSDPHQFLSAMERILADEKGYAQKLANLKASQDLFDWTTGAPFDVYMHMLQCHVVPETCQQHQTQKSSLVYPALRLPEPSSSSSAFARNNILGDDDDDATCASNNETGQLFEWPAHVAVTDLETYVSQRSRHRREGKGVDENHHNGTTAAAAVSKMCYRQEDKSRCSPPCLCSRGAIRNSTRFSFLRSWSGGSSIGDGAIGFVAAGRGPLYSFPRRKNRRKKLPQIDMGRLQASLAKAKTRRKSYTTKRWGSGSRRRYRRKKFG